MTLHYNIRWGMWDRRGDRQAGRAMALAPAGGKQPALKRRVEQKHPPFGGALAGRRPTKGEGGRAGTARIAGWRENLSKHVSKCFPK